MSTKYVVVDGSNIATEGRSLPSLRQLDEAVRAFLTEHPADQLTVVVDATFGHRIDPSERAAYEEAVLAGELVSPPAGAIGRGDAFVLQIADKVGAVIFSNDSFQEFHGQYPWLFDEGRLIGGKPVPGLGWVFVMRTPVRGPASRRSVKEARSGGRATKAAQPAKTAKTAKSAKTTKAAKASKAKKGGRVTEPKKDGKAADPQGSGRSRRRRTPAKPGEPLNELLPFLDFVAVHPVGSEVDGEVESFSSHGAYATVDDIRCYVPLKAMGEPPPLRARDVLSVGETRAFVVTSVDAPRRGVDLALPTGVEITRTGASQLPHGVPIGTVARVHARAEDAKDDIRGAVTATTLVVDHPAEEAPVTPVKKAAAKKAVKKTTARKSTARKAPARKTAAKRAPARKTAARKTTARKSTARKSTAKKAPARKSAAKKAPARKSTAKKAPARKTAARKTAKRAPARKTAARKTAKRAPARKTAARKTAKRAPARKTAARKTTARKTTARRSTARKTAARKR
jgi:hypothetical protein